MPDDIDAPDPDGADVRSDVDDLLRDIGAACGVGLDTAAESGRPSGWFSQAVDQLAAGQVPDLASATPSGGDTEATNLDPGPQEDSFPAALSPDAPLPGSPQAPDAGDVGGSVAAEATQESAPDPSVAVASAAPEKESPDAAAAIGETEEDPFGGAVFFQAPGDDLGLASVPPEANATADEPVARDGASASPPATRYVGDADLRRLDDDLADDVEDLLQGNFDTVSAVLEDSFGDAAIPERTPGPTLSPASLDAPDPVPADPVPAEPVTAEPVTAEPVTAEPVPTEPVPTEPVPAEPVTAEPVTAEPRQARQTGEPLPARTAVKTDRLPQTVSELMDPREREPAGELLPDRTVSVAFDDADEPDAESEPGQEPPPPVAVAPVQHDETPLEQVAPQEPSVSPPGWRAILMELLAIISYPLRFVPPPLRPVVDWIALSLVFWVPIVWVIAIFMVGQRT